MFKGTSKDMFISEKINEAILCKNWGCTPSQIQNENAEDVEIHTMIYSQLMEKNPLF